MADQPYGAPRHTWIEKAGTTMRHLNYVHDQKQAVFLADPDPDPAFNPDPDITGLNYFHRFILLIR
jgi:hypothetical protein